MAIGQGAARDVPLGDAHHGPRADVGAVEGHLPGDRDPAGRLVERLAREEAHPSRQPGHLAPPDAADLVGLVAEGGRHLVEVRTARGRREPRPSCPWSSRCSRTGRRSGPGSGGRHGRPGCRRPRSAPPAGGPSTPVRAGPFPGRRAARRRYPSTAAGVKTGQRTVTASAVSAGHSAPQRSPRAKLASCQTVSGPDQALAQRSREPEARPRTRRRCSAAAVWARAQGAGSGALPAAGAAHAAAVCRSRPAHPASPTWSAVPDGALLQIAARLAAGAGAAPDEGHPVGGAEEGREQVSAPVRVEEGEQTGGARSPCGTPPRRPP